MSYERLNLKTGQVITEEVFAHLEDGIEGAANAVLMTPILYANLVALRDAGKLKAGMFYRITDYVTTTIQENTQSAGHAFDVIVMATDSQTLSEDARAIVHEGDTYFTEAGANLAAWKLWYSLDNDSARFAWADAENGKGVIYRLIDEWGNDCPYDFKSILFKKEVNGEETYIPTFADDLSAECTNNIIGVLSDESKQRLNEIIFGEQCKFNKFGRSCTKNSLGDRCSNNTFGNQCSNNTFGNQCSNNTFGNLIMANSFGADCTHNTLGNLVNANSFGNGCSFMTLGNACISCSVKQKDGQLAHYCQYIQFDNNCVGVTLQNDETASAFQQIKKYRIASGMSGMVEVTRELAYETTIAKATDGTIKQFNLADLAN